MKKVAIIGASGRTGKELVEQSIKMGLHPVCLVRDKSKLTFDHNKASIVIGSPIEYNDVIKTIGDCSCVLVALNISRKSDWPWAQVTTPLNLFSECTKNIVKAMDEKGLKRIITVSAWGVGDSYEETNWIFKFLINRTNVGKAYLGHEDQEKLLRNSNLNWTSVRPVGLTNGKNHKPILIRTKKEHPLKLRISRKDVAKFMLDILDDEKYFKSCPSISNA